MIHVICSRWGDKYDISYVNILYSMVYRYLPTRFQFYCQTEDTKGMDGKIIQLPFLNDLPQSTPGDMMNCNDYKYGLARLWDRPKLNYFKPNCWGLKGIKIFLDLDVIIHNDMSPILEFYSGRPISARSWWHNMIHEKRPDWRHRNGARNNGSLYLIEDEQTQEIWNDLLLNWEKIYFIYTGGSDNFISTRHLALFDFLPPSMVYSFNRGCEWPDNLVKHTILKDRIICLFNKDPNNPANINVHEAAILYPEVSKIWK